MPMRRYRTDQQPTLKIPSVPAVIRAAVLLTGIVLAGCASSIPEDIRRPPEPDLPIAPVAANPENHVGSAVRWGGEVVTVNNGASDTRVEIISRSLYGDGYPASGNDSGGRFIALVDGFVDPALLPEGRLITVFGTVEGIIRQPIGEYDYRYPLVRVRTYTLWERRQAAPHPPYPNWPWYDPWYGPWYDPWYDPWRYPWRHPRHFK